STECCFSPAKAVPPRSNSTPARLIFKKKQEWFRPPLAKASPQPITFNVSSFIEVLLLGNILLPSLFFRYETFCIDPKLHFSYRHPGPVAGLVPQSTPRWSLQKSDAPSTLCRSAAKGRAWGKQPFQAVGHRCEKESAGAAQH